MDTALDESILKHRDVLDELEKECLAVKVVEVPAAAKHGTNQHSEGPYTNNNIRSTSYGTSADYRLAKLKRDAPEIAKRVEAGEFKSVAIMGLLDQRPSQLNTD